MGYRPTIAVNQFVLSDDEVLVVLVALRNYTKLVQSTNTEKMDRREYRFFGQLLATVDSVNNIIDAAVHRRDRI